MTRRLRLCLLAALPTVLATLTVPATAASPSSGSDDPAALARHRLSADASGRIVTDRDASGAVRFVGTGAHATISNPDVHDGASVATAARAHLDRYGASLGAASGTTFVRRSTTHTVSGVEAVSYVQHVDGVPVIGGEVVVSVGPDRELRSMASSVSHGASPRDATVPEPTAAETARKLVRRTVGSSRPLDVTSVGRGLLDPDLVGVSLPSGPRTVWQFEVGDDAAIRQLVLVDDRTGHVLLRADLVQNADRVVCDQAGVPGSDTACTSGFARTESGPASSVADVNNAFDLSGAVSDFYQQVAGIDLTQLLGVSVSGGRKLASTVRFCPPSYEGDCPFANAFWNGQQMFYGEGWAGADDVVGHEMTHGFIDQHARLFYWGQSGAINESMADVIGEIVDHRHPSAGDAANDWRLGEDSPAGTVRSLSDPTAYGQPDRTGSSLYALDPDYLDNGGVHTNSGVGNKTAYLISQGGTFNGQTITGIDGTDDDLTKTAKLYVDVIERLSSGADWAALAQQLDQSCQDLVAWGNIGLTAANCAAVHQAGVATELATTPTNAAQPADAPTTCPATTSKRVLYGGVDYPDVDPVADFGWGATTSAGYSNATSGLRSWFGVDPDYQAAAALKIPDPVTVPAGQSTYLSFEGWYLLDHSDGTYYDGGTVDVSQNGGAAVSAAGLPWVNGPEKPLTAPNAGVKAFAGDSRGWVRSRVELTSYAGSTIRPQFTLRSDDIVGYIGWYLDDITVYTCDPVPSAARGVHASGFLGGMTVHWTPPAVHPGAVTGYFVYVEPCSIARTVPATSTSLTVITKGKGCGSVLKAVVVPLGHGGAPSPSSSARVLLGMAGMNATRSGSYLTFKGALGTWYGQLSGRYVQIQRKSASGWVTVRTVKTGSRGRFSTRIRQRKRAYFRVAYLGGPNLIGTATGGRRW